MPPNTTATSCKARSIAAACLLIAFASCTVAGPKNCIAPDSKSVWDSGINDTYAWVQFGRLDQKKSTLNFLRSRQTGGIVISVNNIEAALPPKQEVPGFVSFSMDAIHPAPSFITIGGFDGIEIVERQEDGSVTLFSGNINIDQDGDRKTTAKLINAIRSDIQVWVHKTCYWFPIDARTRTALRTLYLNTTTFKQRAPSSFKHRN